MGVIVLGLIASQVGGSRIRASHEIQIGRLLLSSDQVLPGVPVHITYDLVDIEGVNDIAMIMVRTAEESVVVGEVSTTELGEGRFTAVVPCSSDLYEQAQKSKARFVLISDNSGVLAQSGTFEMLPPGPDCVYQQ